MPTPSGDGSSSVSIHTAMAEVPNGGLRQSQPVTSSGQLDHAPDHGDLSESLAKTMVTSSKDAMGFLFQAAAQNDVDSRSDDDDLTGGPSNPQDALSDAASPELYPQAQLPPHVSKETLGLWNKHRFVVQGWYSASEAIAYLQL